MDLPTLLTEALAQGATDIFLRADHPPMVRRRGDLEPLNEQVLTAEQAQTFAFSVLTEEQQQSVGQARDVSSVVEIPDLGRFRFSVYRQNGTVAAVFMPLPERVLTLDELGFPDDQTQTLRALAHRGRGLILVAGPTGCGKTTTILAMLEQINRENRCHITCLADPLEYFLEPKQAFIDHRQAGRDFESFSWACRHLLHQDPDVVFISEMRDLETVLLALTLAETGHLVFTTVHTATAPATIQRIVEVFPPEQQPQVRSQLAQVLAGVVVQQLLPRDDRTGRVIALEILVATGEIRRLIREKSPDLEMALETGAAEGMVSLDQSLLRLYQAGVLGYERAQAHLAHPSRLGPPPGGSSGRE